MNDRHDLDDLGEQLRALGHRRRELAERVFEEAANGNLAGSQASYRELDEVTGQAVGLMQRQLEELGGRLGAGGDRRSEAGERAYTQARHSDPGAG